MSPYERRTAHSSSCRAVLTSSRRQSSTLINNTSERSFWTKTKMSTLCSISAYGFPPPRGAGGTFGCYRRAKWGPFPLDKREHPCDVCCALFSSLVQESCWPRYNRSFFVDVIEVSRFSTMKPVQVLRVSIVTLFSDVRFASVVRSTSGYIVSGFQVAL